VAGGAQFHGKGKFRWKTGDVYEGEFHHGKRHGRGVCISRSAGVPVPLSPPQLRFACNR